MRSTTSVSLGSIGLASSAAAVDCTIYLSMHLATSGIYQCWVPTRLRAGKAPTDDRFNVFAPVRGIEEFSGPQSKRQRVIEFAEVVKDLCPPSRWLSGASSDRVERRAFPGAGPPLKPPTRPVRALQTFRLRRGPRCGVSGSEFKGPRPREKGDPSATRLRAHFRHGVRDLGPELIDDSIEFLQRVDLKLGLGLVEQRDDARWWGDQLAHATSLRGRVPALVSGAPTAIFKRRALKVGG